MGWENSKPTIVMVACQFMYAGVNLSSRAVLLEGMSSRVFVVYRQCFAFLLIVPVAYFSRRGTKECFPGWKTFWFIFFLSFVGVTLNQNLYFEGLYLASSSAASALGNLVPAITFVMAYLLGLEKVNVRRWGSIAKISGTTVCVSGAVAMAVFKGPKLLNMEIMPTNSITYHFSGLGSSNSSGHDTWLLGCLFLFGNCCCWSLWLILQVNVSALYPDHLSLTAWLCFLSAAQSGIVTVIVEPRAISWLSTTRFQLICCFCAGLTAAITFFAQTWCIAKRGPVFSAMFNPLCTIIVAILACIFLNEELYTGRSMLKGPTQALIPKHLR